MSIATVLGITQTLLLVILMFIFIHTINLLKSRNEALVLKNEALVLKVSIAEASLKETTKLCEKVKKELDSIRKVRCGKSY